MTDEALAHLRTLEKAKEATMREREAGFKAARSEWSIIWNQIQDEECRRTHFAEFQAELAKTQEQNVFSLAQAANMGAALAGGATTLAECTKEGA